MTLALKLKTYQLRKATWQAEYRRRQIASSFEEKEEAMKNAVATVGVIATLGSAITVDPTIVVDTTIVNDVPTMPSMPTDAMQELANGAQAVHALVNEARAVNELVSKVQSVQNLTTGVESIVTETQALINSVSAIKSLPPVVEAQLVQEAEVAQSPQLVQEAEVAQVSQLVQEAEVAQASQLVQEAEVAQAPQLVQEAEVAQASQLVQEAEVAQAPQLVQEAEVAQSPQLVQEVEVAQASQLVQEAEVAQAPQLVQVGVSKGQFIKYGMTIPVYDITDEFFFSNGMSTGDLQLTDAEYTALCKVVVVEAGGEPLAGKIIVANAVLNRVRSNNTNVITEVNRENQFASIANIGEGRITSEIKQAVNMALDKDYTRGVLKAISDEQNNGALWFYSPKYIGEGQLKKRKNIKVAVRYGGHVFYGIWDR